MRLRFIEVVLHRHAAEQKVVVSALAWPQLSWLDAIQPFDRVVHPLQAKVGESKDQTHTAQIGKHMTTDNRVIPTAAPQLPCVYNNAV